MCCGGGGGLLMGCCACAACELCLAFAGILSFALAVAGETSVLHVAVDVEEEKVLLLLVAELGCEDDDCSESVAEVGRDVSRDESLAFVSIS